MSTQPRDGERDSSRPRRISLIDQASHGDSDAFRHSGMVPRMVMSSGVPIGLGSRDETHYIAIWRNIMFAGFSGSVESHMLRSMGAAVLHQLERYPSGIGLVVVAEPGCRPPAAALREEMLALRRRTVDRTLGIAFVLRGEGFAASALRAAITGIQIVIRSSFPEKVFSDPSQGIDWIAPHCGVDAPADLSECHRAMQSLLAGDGFESS